MHSAEALPSFQADTLLAPPPAHRDIPALELELRPLRGAAEIAEIEALRRQIPLPAEVVGQPGFQALEKKETSWASSRHLTGGAARSAH